MDLGDGAQTLGREVLSGFFAALLAGSTVQNHVNETARAYGNFEKAGKFPEGSVIAKDSFSITETVGILLGSLFVMEKMPRGFNYVSGDWKYSVIKPDGRLFGETNGKGSGRVEYCITCHLAREAFDHLFFVPEAVRVKR